MCSPTQRLLGEAMAHTLDKKTEREYRKCFQALHTHAEQWRANCAQLTSLLQSACTLLPQCHALTRTVLQPNSADAIEFGALRAFGVQALGTRLISKYVQQLTLLTKALKVTSTALHDETVAPVERLVTDTFALIEGSGAASGPSAQLHVVSTPQLTLFTAPLSPTSHSHAATSVIVSPAAAASASGGVWEASADATNPSIAEALDGLEQCHHLYAAACERIQAFVAQFCTVASGVTVPPTTEEPNTPLAAASASSLSVAAEPARDVKSIPSSPAPAAAAAPTAATDSTPTSASSELTFDEPACKLILKQWLALLHSIDSTTPETGPGLDPFVKQLCSTVHTGKPASVQDLLF
jgi:hypothetical protein